MVSVLVQVVQVVLEEEGQALLMLQLLQEQQILEEVEEVLVEMEVLIVVLVVDA